MRTPVLLTKLAAAARLTFGALLLASFLQTQAQDASDEPRSASPNASRTADPARSAKLAERERLWNSARTSASSGKISEALRDGHQVLELDQELFGTRARETQQSASWLAGGHQALGNWHTERQEWEKAKEQYQTAVDLLTEAFGAAHWKTRDAQWKIRTVALVAAMPDADYREWSQVTPKIVNVLRLNSRGEYRAALALAEEVLSTQERLLREHPYTAAALSNVASLYEALGDHTRAEPLYQRNLTICEAALGPEHPSTAQALNDLGLLYLQTSSYLQAEPLLQRSVATWQTSLGPDDANTAKGLNSLGLLYFHLSDFSRAEPLYRRSLAIREKVLGPEHSDTATSLNNLAQLYVAMGDFARAEPLCQRSQDIREKTWGRDHPKTALSLNNLAQLYVTMGDNARAESLYQRSLAIFEKALGSDHPDTATALNNLAQLYAAMGDYARAEPRFQRSLEIDEYVLGPEHRDTARDLNNLGLLYITMHDYARAEPLCRRSLEMRERVLGPEHPDTATSLNNLAGLYTELGEYARAEPLYLRSLDVREKILGPDHPDTAVSLTNLAHLYEVYGDGERSEPLYERSLAITTRLAENAAAVLSERQQLAMQQMLRYRLDLYLSSLLAHGGRDRQALAAVLHWKGATLVRQRAMRLAAAEPELAPVLAELQRVSRHWAALATGVPQGDVNERRERVAALAETKERLEAELSSRSATYRQATGQFNVEQLLEVLPAEAALVDLLEFSKSSGGAKSERHLLAFVVRPNHPLRMVDLGPVDLVNSAIEAWRKTYGVSAEGRAAGQQLRARLWEPLAESLRDVDLVLISPDGAVGRLAFAALPGAAPGTYLIEDYCLALVPVPQLLPALFNDDTPGPASKELLLLGDVDYDCPPQVAPGDEAPSKDSDVKNVATSGRWNRLPGTAAEIAAIKEHYERYLPVEPSGIEELTGCRATEAQFRQLAPQCRNLHLATHGYFAAPDRRSAISAEAAAEAESRTRNGLRTGRQEILRGYSPGLLSGLVLSGANTAFDETGDDGYLTADELAFLPLGGVQLATLSACETGLGEVAGGEGLLGIQRALQVAGVRTVVSSLWKVDDAATRQFMDQFYRNRLEKKLNMLDAFREAQLWALRNPELILRGAARGAVDPDDLEDPNRLSPKFWAGFVLSGGLAPNAAP